MDLSLPPELPISGRADDIAEAVAGHQVVVVAGETGSGKTTQLPKICLRLGRGRIGHTQPRRIAARSVAERLAAETRTELGALVGYQVRFTRKASARTRVKVMTDGVLLAEISHDRDLRRYDTIIIDEAHERSLNIDFLLGYLKQLLPRRPDLKLIITSATIDTARFAEHFADADGNPAPIIAVSGRSYPVEIRYRPPEPETDQVDGICAAVEELVTELDGDVLVFLSGEREIRDAAEAVAAMNLPRTEVLPLYARLSAAEQHRVFSSHTGRRIVLSTNVAETSLTVPGIRAVVDTGTARISRYSARTKVQRLPIEPVSQASANQRAGRCGRLGPGVCIRLYAEDDFVGRPEFTEPEILRTNLASVILQMTAAGLGEIASFPFVEAPDSAQIADGLRLLDELGAVRDAREQRPRLTAVGRRLAGIPLDPRMGRMLLAGERQGCLTEMLVIVAGLSVQDPRERPAEHQQAADAAHRRFWAPLASPDAPDPTGAAGAAGPRGTTQGTASDPGRADEPKRRQRDGAPDAAPESDGSDFLALLRLWDYLRGRQRELSGNAFRRMCRDEFLHFLRIREWQDLHGQLRQIAKDLGLNRNDTPAAADRIHTAILTGLLSQVGLADLREEKRGRHAGPGAPKGRRNRPGPREYLGARGTKFAINPGSSVARTQPPLVMAAEIVETSRLWARTVAGIDVGQIEEVGAHLLKRHYSEPAWSSRSGSVLAHETVTLLGIPIVAGRRVGYGTIDPVVSREIFLRSALVEGDWRTRHHFFARNQALRAEIEGLEERVRRRDVLVDDQVIYDFYDARVPVGIVSAAHFDRWWRDERRTHPDLLDLSEDDLVAADGTAVRAADFPDRWTVGTGAAAVDLEVRYVFAPGTEEDGVSLEVPLPVLGRLDPDVFGWQVPGFRSELATELIRGLPKQLRTAFVPAPEYARRALARIRSEAPDPFGRTAGAGSFPAALGRALRAETGVAVPEDAWRPDELPDHLRPTFVVRERGDVVGEGKDLAALQQRLLARSVRSLNAAASSWTRQGQTAWTFGVVPRRVELDRETGRGASAAVPGFPHLVDEGGTVGLALATGQDAADRAHRRGLVRLVTLTAPDPTRWAVSHMSNQTKLALGTSPYPGVPQLLADARFAATAGLVDRHAGPDGPAGVRDPETFARLVDRVRAEQADAMKQVVDLAGETLAAWQQLRLALPAARRSGHPAAVAAADDVTEQLANLVFDRFCSVTGPDRLADLPRYLRAAQLRLEALPARPGKDAEALELVLGCEDAYAELCAAQPPGPLPAAVEEIGWLIEELRVSLFAQSLRTRQPVSVKRVRTAIAELARR
nr:ATP-dependent RNA helicase HrpA [Microlunatus kandeliicorticis]